MYHPYCHSPSTLTEYLKQKLHLQQAKRLGRSLPAQVERSVQLERNRRRTFCASLWLLACAPRWGGANPTCGGWGNACPRIEQEAYQAYPSLLCRSCCARSFARKRLRDRGGTPLHSALLPTTQLSEASLFTHALHTWRMGKGQG